MLQASSTFLSQMHLSLNFASLPYGKLLKNHFGPKFTKLRSASLRISVSSSFEVSWVKISYIFGLNSIDYMKILVLCE